MRGQLLRHYLTDKGQYRLMWIPRLYFPAFDWPERITIAIVEAFSHSTSWVQCTMHAGCFDMTEKTSTTVTLLSSLSTLDCRSIFAFLPGNRFKKDRAALSCAGEGEPAPKHAIRVINRLFVFDLALRKSKAPIVSLSRVAAAAMEYKRKEEDR